MSNHPLRSAALACLVLMVAACSSAPPSPSPSGGAPTPSPTGTSLDHPTGATDVVLRFDEGGGFVPMEFIAAHVPIFTLYGDGTVVFQGVAVPMAPPAEGEPSVGQALRTGRLSEDQVQALLQFALLDGGLAAARDRYDNPLVADAPTATFEVHAAGDSKTVSVVALGMDAEPGPDTAIKAAFVKLAERLRNFDQAGTLPGAAYVPERYRGVLIDAAALQGAKIWPWPWADVAPADFRLPQEPNAFQQRTHTLTPAQAEAIGVAGYEGGIQAGLFLRGPDASLYTLVLRPLLPDEAA